MNRIESALDLVCGNMGEGWFVIIEDSETEKFVQFAYDEDCGLYFDLPTIELKPEEKDRAIHVFSRFGLDLSGLDTEFPESINLDVGRDKKLAAKIAEDVFLEVFCLSRSSVFNISIDR